MPRKKLFDATLLQAALEGLEQQRQELEKKIATVRSMLGVRKGFRGAGLVAKPKRILSAAARKRIADAQRRRWALVKAKAAKKTGKTAETA
jgi:hypothetical protein